MHSTKFWSNMMKKNISASFYQKHLILCSKILNVLHNISLTVLIPWQHTGFQTSSIWKAFLATFRFPFCYFLLVPHMHDLPSIHVSEKHWRDCIAPIAPVIWSSFPVKKSVVCSGNHCILAFSYWLIKWYYWISLYCNYSNVAHPDLHT